MLDEGDAVSHELAVPTRTLADCEVVIERGLKTFVEVGEALLAIRDQRLYRAGYATFEDYCQERWGWGRNYINKQISAAEIVRELPVGTIVPTTESQARELAPLRDEPERMVRSASQLPLLEAAS